MKTKKVNIGTEAKLKFAKIGDYWDETTVDKVVELLHEYQYLSLLSFWILKSIIGNLGVMKITLKPDAKPVKQCP